MTLPATKVQELRGQYVELLVDRSTPVDQLTLRRIIRLGELELRNAHPDEIDSLFNLIGLAWDRLGSFERALEAHRNAMRHAPANAVHMNNMASALLELGRPEEGLAMLRKALDLRESAADCDLMIRVNEAEALFKLGDVTAARASLRAAAAIANPSDRHDLFVLAMQSAVIGNEDDAAEFFARHLAAVQGVELGDASAVEFILAAPAELLSGMREIPALSGAIDHVIAREQATPPDESVSLSPDALSRLHELVENPPEPGEALRRLLHDRRA